MGVLDISFVTSSGIKGAIWTHSEGDSLICSLVVEDAHEPAQTILHALLSELNMDSEKRIDEIELGSDSAEIKLDILDLEFLLRKMPSICGPRKPAKKLSMWDLWEDAEREELDAKFRRERERRSKWIQVFP